MVCLNYAWPSIRYNRTNFHALAASDRVNAIHLIEIIMEPIIGKFVLYVKQNKNKAGEAN